MRTETIVESREAVLALSPSEAAGLRDIGLRLASKKSWWGAPDSDEDDAERTVVRVRPVDSGHWAVRISDAVGVVSIGDLQLVVEPKIPILHLLYLLAKSREFPRLDQQLAELAVSASMWELVAHWFVDATERLMRLGLVRDYLEVSAPLEAASGRIEVLGTTAHYYSGRLTLDCTFDEYGFDTPLNRVVLAASREVARSVALPPALRQRSIRLTARMDEIGPLEPDDLGVGLDRRTSHYQTALLLARQVLKHLGRHLTEGAEVASTFLIRTPEMVEAGVRAVLAERLGHNRVRKEGRQLIGTALTFNPDLVFDDGSAVGDVKYKLSDGTWPRGDLYQLIAFAEAFGASRGLLLRFRRETLTSAAPDLLVGSQALSEVTWRASDEVSPESAAANVAEAVALWLDSGLELLSA